MIEFRYCRDCGYCRYNKKGDYCYCKQFEGIIQEVNENADGCTFGIDIPEVFEDEDKAYERYKYRDE